MPVPGQQASPDRGISETEAEMAVQPEIVQCTEQPYVAVRAPAASQTLGEVPAGLHPKSRRWLRSQGVQSAGQSFSKNQEERHRYGPAASDRGLLPGRCPGRRPRPGAHGFLPAGRYATLRHTGHPDGLLVGSTRTLLDRAAQQTLAWASRPRPMASRKVAVRRVITTNPGRNMNEREIEPRILARRLMRDRVILRGADSVSAAGRCCSIWCCRGQE
jgi:hypothetical protein